MFNTKKFGAYISKLRKDRDMTQNELADQLNLTRQAISKYEVGDSFPDISILMLISDIFEITLDELIKSGEPTQGEAIILENIAKGKVNIIPNDVTDILNIAPLIKPSVLANLASKLENEGIDINHIINLAEYLNDGSVQKLLENASFDTINEELLEWLIPSLDERSKQVIFGKILDGELDWHLITVLLPYAEYFISHIEAAVVEGVLPKEALDAMREGVVELFKKQGN
ncbi:MAG: hypothetical protein K0Q49_71 [Haloplasmataceae bacterium]|jgi:transcriptional regulator with XRE-family HTH domain|nr:hypothetical protein [Haloplasmataceae bacterium]